MGRRRRGYGRRDLIKKWVVNIIHNQHTDEELPISVDPDSGKFWCEFPEDPNE